MHPDIDQNSNTMRRQTGNGHVRLRPVMQPLYYYTDSLPVALLQINCIRAHIMQPLYVYMTIL